MAAGLRADFEGHGELRGDCLAAPKYGNVDDSEQSSKALPFRALGFQALGFQALLIRLVASWAQASAQPGRDQTPDAGATVVSDFLEETGQRFCGTWL